ncbi:hypothetical protein KSW81_004325 [Nannochloris sp. 'desiccata']|nr:hypothetical protein KSW81_004325 [Chlorella desiccata (nom. nud.)]
MEPGETPLLYKGIVLHSYQGVSHKKYLLKPSSRPNFLKYVESFGNVIGVIPLEEFDPESDELLSPTLPSEVELRDGAQFIESLEGWKRNRTEALERQLGKALKKYALGRGHKQVEVVCNLKVVGPAGDCRELDAVAFAGECVYVESGLNVAAKVRRQANLWALWRRRIPRIKN